MRLAGAACAAICVAVAIGGDARASDLSVGALNARAPSPYVRAPLWFIEGNAGGSWGGYDNLLFFDPIDAPNGNLVPLNGNSLTSSSVAAGAAIGYYLLPEVFFVAVNYQHYGAFKAKGFGVIPAGTSEQDFKTSADGLLVTLGADLSLAGTIFIEPTVAVGAGFLHSTGVQSANLGAAVSFPSHDYVNFIAGGGLGVGSHVTPNFDLLLEGNFMWFGRTFTNATPNPAPAGMNPGEALQADLGVFTLTGVARLHF
jgi:hypothetical protein